MRGRARGVVAAGLLLAAAGCGAGRAAREADRPFTGGLAEVESLQVEPQPPKHPVIRVVARGTLPDACTRIDREQHERRGRRIRVTLTTRRESGATCAAAPRPFARMLLFQVAELPPGLYELDVNGVEAVFEVVPNEELHRGIHRYEID